MVGLVSSNQSGDRQQFAGDDDKVSFAGSFWRLGLFILGEDGTILTTPKKYITYLFIYVLVKR